ncbi:MAG: hypothetical protein AB1772_13375, partial [Candidatus Zixiibacteriota bacterium]
MRRFLSLVFLLCLIPSIAFGANYYVDSATGSNGDNGTTQALAWATIEYALESGGLTAGDYVWVRRNHSEIPVSDILPAYDGTAQLPLTVACYPRSYRAITQADWTNGGTTVDNVVGLTLARSDHQARMITGPDSRKYFISRIVDANTFMILTPYKGTTVTGVNGACSIDADDLYSSRPADVDGWDSDDDTLPLIDFNSQAYNVYLAVDYVHRFIGIEFKNSADTFGPIQASESYAVLVINCLFS